MTVCFATFCHQKHLPRLHAEGQLAGMMETHRYPFDEVIVVHQRCGGVEYRPFDEAAVRIVESEDYPNILRLFGLDEDDPVAARDCHGPNAAHWWVWHVINHLIVLVEAEADYIVFSDCDCNISASAERSWVEEGIDILRRYPEVLLVSPGDGGDMFERRIPEARLTRNVSQQLFLVERERFGSIKFSLDWNWEYLAPGGPMQEYYHMLEGRIWRYLHRFHLWRAILPDRWRYWHWQW